MHCAVLEPALLLLSDRDAATDDALCVFARALESNRNSQELWFHYLTVFSRSKDTSELQTTFRKALQYAPSYQLHWKAGNLLHFTNLL